MSEPWSVVYDLHSKTVPPNRRVLLTLFTVVPSGYLRQLGQDLGSYSKRFSPSLTSPHPTGY